MTRTATFMMALLVGGARAAPALAAATTAFMPACTAVEGDYISARDAARALPGFSAVPPDTQIAHAPVPGARRFFSVAELDRLAKHYSVPVAPAGEICFERAMEPLSLERVADAMRKALGNPEAHIEITESSLYPVPRGDILFTRSSLPSGSATPVLWRGFVRYGAEHRFVIWARVRILVRSVRVVAVENLRAGNPIEAKQVRLEELEMFPQEQQAPPPLDEIVGKIPLRPIAAGTAIALTQLEEPKDIRRGDLIKVEVSSGGARLQLDGRAQADGRTGETIPVRNVTTGKVFSARVSEKGRVVLIASRPPAAKDINQ
jgi:flagella basal body P-ring formation protein FlgA